MGGGTKNRMNRPAEDPRRELERSENLVSSGYLLIWSFMRTDTYSTH